VCVAFLAALSITLREQVGDDDHDEEDDGHDDPGNPGLRLVSLGESDTLEKECEAVADGDSHRDDGDNLEEALEEQVERYEEGANLLECELALFTTFRLVGRRGGGEHCGWHVVLSGKPGSLSCNLQFLALVRKSLEGDHQSVLESELWFDLAFDFCVVARDRFIITRLSRVSEGVESLTQVVFIECHVSTPVLSMGFCAVAH